MNASPDPVSWYSSHAAAIAPVYDALDSATLHGWLDGLVPPAPALVLDVGAGTGRDGACLASDGHAVFLAHHAKRDEPLLVIACVGRRCPIGDRTFFLNHLTSSPQPPCCCH
jgi:hypothetical protein